MERQRTDEMAEQIVLQDMALSFELLRAVNTAQVRGTQIAGSGPVLTMRRAIAMVGLNGVRRAALSLRAWPGPLDAAGAARAAARDRPRAPAGRIAQLLRPAGYDAEVVYLVALLQNLGPAGPCYHFPDEAEQIAAADASRAAAEAPAQPSEPGMSEEARVVRRARRRHRSAGRRGGAPLGPGRDVLHMIRRFGAGTPVRTTDSDADMLRAAASAPTKRSTR